MRIGIGWEGLGENLRRKGEDERGELAGQFSGTFCSAVRGLSWTFGFRFSDIYILALGNVCCKVTSVQGSLFGLIYLFVRKGVSKKCVFIDRSDRVAVFFLAMMLYEFDDYYDT